MAKKHAVKAHNRKAPTRRPAFERAPKPGPNEFSPEQETAMRQGMRARMAADQEMAGMEADAARPVE